MTIPSQDELEARRSSTVGVLLERTGCLVAALDSNGLVAAMPVGPPVDGHRVIESGSTLDYILAADHAAVSKVFSESHQSGMGSEPVRLASDPDRWVTIASADLRDEYGVFLAVIYDTEDHGPSSVVSAVPTLRERSGQVWYDRAGIVLGCNDGWPGLMGWSREDIVGTRAMGGVHPDDQAAVVDAWMAVVATGRPRHFRLRLLHKDGYWRWVEQVFHNRLDGTEDEHVLGDIVDVHDEVMAQKALRAQEQLLNRLAQAVPVGLVQVDTEGVVAYANDRLHEMLGTPGTAGLDDLFSTVVPDDRRAVLAAFENVLRSGDDEGVQAEISIPDTGDARRCLIELRALVSEEGSITGAIACVSDITASARAQVHLERELIDNARHDHLTGLANRLLIFARMDDALARARSDEGAVAVLLADLDGFKQINDSLGHSAGDEILRSVADRLRPMLHANDTAARIGGDEFVVLLGDYIDPKRPRRLAEAILAALARPFEVDGRSLRLSASIGIATNASSNDAEELLRDVDLAMYRAKAEGRNRIATFAPEMHEAVMGRVELESDLRAAIENEQLFLVYQPIHDLATGSITSFEALVRWHHPTRGLVSPIDFIPLAEETGLIVPLGRDVLNRACAEAARWVGNGAFAPRVSVNLSGGQLDSPTLIDDIAGALERSGLPGTRLMLEITETVLMADPDRYAELFAQIRALGVALAIDDFGTGYSSLAYLQRLPVDVLKIDKSFVDRLTTDSRSAALIDGILGLTRNLFLTAVAEGIETEAQRDALRALGCNSGQGYLFSRPLPADRIEAYSAAAGPLMASH